MGIKANNLIGVGLEPLKAALLETNSLINPSLDSVSAAITATGTTITDAFPLVSIINNISVAAASTGVKLPNVNVGPQSGTTYGIGTSIGIRNSGANTVNVWPATSSETINGGSAGAAVTIASGSASEFRKITATGWIVI